jgi:solute carrier family 12 sodium/potassium/chloride transporter 2
MFMIDYFTALITFFLIGALFAYLYFREPDVNWGTSTQAFAYLSTLHSILRLQHTPDHVKTFRPQILALTGNPMDRQSLVTLVSCVTKNSSMMVCGNIIDSVNNHSATPDNVRKWMAACRVKSFYSAIMASTYRQGAASLMQVAGLGKYKPNVIFMGYKEDWQAANHKDVEDYVNVIYDAFDFHCSVCILRKPVPNWLDRKEQSNGKAEEDALAGETNKRDMMRRGRVETVINLTSDNIFQQCQPQGTIDIWWLYDDGGLTVLIPHLLSLNWRWAHCKLRVFISGSRAKEEQERESMHELLRKFRIEVKAVKIVPEIKGRPSREVWDEYSGMQDQYVEDEEGAPPSAFIPQDQVNDRKCVRLTKRQVRIGETVRKYSCTSTLVVLNLPMPASVDAGHYLYMCWLETLTRGLPPCVVMRGNQDSVLTFYS